MDHNNHDMGMETTEMSMHTSQDTHDGSHENTNHPTESHMAMSFYFGVENVTILFPSCVVQTAGQMVGACILFFILSILYEGLKIYREILLKQTLVRYRGSEPSLIQSETVEELSSNRSNTILQPHAVTRYEETKITPKRKSLGFRSSPHLIQTLLHVLQVIISYSLMLVVMSYNGYLVISVLLGAALGYYAFGWKKSVIVDVEEHCH